MNRNRLLLIGFVAIALGGFISLSVYRSLESSTAANRRAGAGVLVAADNIQLGARIEEKDLKLVSMPEADVPQGSFRDKSQVVGRGAILPISQGDFILRNKIAGQNAGSGLPALIPPGMLAMSVRVNEVVGVAGFVQPGTRVDVLVTATPSGANEEQTSTVLRNVAVIAAGQRLEHNSSGEAQVSPVITLLVSPDDAQRLSLASNEGRIQLALRNPLDTNQASLPPTSAGSLFGRQAAPAATHVVRHTATHAQAAPAPPEAFSVEVYKGTKKEETKFDEESNGQTN
jgi:pilus assembly protein CpaB